MFLTVVTTPGPYIAPWGVYAPSNVTGAITWSNGSPYGDAVVMPSVEVWSNASGSPQSFTVSLSVRDASGAVVGSASGSGVVSVGSPVVWSPSSAISVAGAALWHVVATPALYTLSVSVTCGGSVVDSETVTFGIRRTYFDAATGFYLNGVPFKINGTANHQDAAAVGVAVPDHLQAWRVSKLKEMVSGVWYGVL